MTNTPTLWSPGGECRHTLSRPHQVQESPARRMESTLFNMRMLPFWKNLTYLHGGAVLVAFSILLLQHQTSATPEQINSTAGIIINQKDTGLEKVIHLAEAFKASLKEDQLAQLQLAYSKKDAARWSNFPQAFSRPNRVGIALGSLTPAQLAAAKALLACVLAQGTANEGFDEVEGILSADDYFGKTTGKTDEFGSRNFYIAFLGKPSTSELWELQFGGHHLAIANTYSSGKLTGTTPSFRGVEPMAPIAANGKNYRPIEQEKEAFSGLIEKLSDQEKGAAKLSATFSDLLLGPGRDGQFPQTKQGLKAGDLSDAKQKLVIKAMELYVRDLDAAAAKSLMTKYTTAMANTYIAYSGTGTMNQTNDYVRIDGPGIWIEYSVQPSRDFPGTTHPHSVWRDRSSDYGGN